MLRRPCRHMVVSVNACGRSGRQAPAYVLIVAIVMCGEHILFSYVQLTEAREQFSKIETSLDFTKLLA